jgi:acryloyl-coenzyme A reductase
LRTPGPRSHLQHETVGMDFSQGMTGGNVLVKVSACAVAYRDIIDRSGGFPFMNQPTVLGHEVAGVVEQVDESAGAGAGAAESDSSALRVGDKVVSLHWAQLGGRAWPSPFLNEQAMKTFIGLTVDGGYSEYMSTHASAFVKVPAPQLWSGVQAAPVMSTFGTAWQGAVVRGQLQAGETVLVSGASGGVGSAAVAMAKRLGCYTIGTTSDVPRNAAYIEQCGADAVVAAAPGFSKEVARMTGGGVDMALEAVGAPTFQDSLRSLKPGGRLVLIGNVTNENAPLPLGLCIVKSLNIIGTDSIEAGELSRLFSWLDEQRLKPAIDRVLPLARVAEAHELLEDRGGGGGGGGGGVHGRVVLDINKDIWS